MAGEASASGGCAWGRSPSGTEGRCVGWARRCVPPLIASRVVACDRVCWVWWFAGQRGGRRHRWRHPVGGTPTRRLCPRQCREAPCWAGSLDWAGDCRGVCAARISIVSIAVFVGAVERLLDRRARLVAPSRAARANASPLTRTQVRWSARGSANSHADSPGLVPSYGT